MDLDIEVQRRRLSSYIKKINNSMGRFEKFKKIDMLKDMVGILKNDVDELSHRVSKMDHLIQMKIKARKISELFPGYTVMTKGDNHLSLTNNETGIKLDITYYLEYEREEDEILDTPSGIYRCESEGGSGRVEIYFEFSNDQNPFEINIELRSNGEYDDCTTLEDGGVEMLSNFMDNHIDQLREYIINNMINIDQGEDGGLRYEAIDKIRKYVVNYVC